MFFRTRYNLFGALLAAGLLAGAGQCPPAATGADNPSKKNDVEQPQPAKAASPNEAPAKKSAIVVKVFKVLEGGKKVADSNYDYIGADYAKALENFNYFNDLKGYVATWSAPGWPAPPLLKGAEANTVAPASFTTPADKKEDPTKLGAKVASVAGKTGTGTIGAAKVTITYVGKDGKGTFTVDGELTGAGDWQQDGMTLVMETAHSKFTGIIRGDKVAGVRSTKKPGEDGKNALIDWSVTLTKTP